MNEQLEPARGAIGARKPRVILLRSAGYLDRRLSRLPGIPRRSSTSPGSPNSADPGARSPQTSATSAPGAHAIAPTTAERATAAGCDRSDRYYEQSKHPGEGERAQIAARHRPASGTSEYLITLEAVRLTNHGWIKSVDLCRP